MRSTIIPANTVEVVVENNLMGGHEDAQAEWIRQHGTVALAR